jgi:RNA polymerase sigma-70 factor (ECF subfamily)
VRWRVGHEGGRYARVIARDAADADDLVQECLARALSRPHVWDEVRDVRAYLFTMLRHTHVDLTARSRRDFETVSLEEVAAELPCGPDQPQALLLRDLARCLDALPSDRRRIVLLVGLEGMTYQEVADRLCVPLGTVMSRLSRARETLRRLVLEEEPAPLAGDRCFLVSEE